MPRLEIIIVTLLPQEGETGVQTHFNQLGKFARQQDIVVSVITPYAAYQTYRKLTSRVARILKYANAEWAILWNRFFSYLYIREQLRHKLSSSRSSEITIYAQDPLSAKAALYVKTIWPEIRVVAFVHFNISEAYEYTLRGMTRAGGLLYRALMNVEKKVFPRLDAVIFPSEFTRNVLLQRNPDIAGGTLYVIPNFVNQPENLHLSVSGDVVSIGTLEPRKNQQYLLQVVAEAKRLGKAFTLSLMGDGPDRLMLESKAKSLGISDRVHFLGFQKNAVRLLGGYRLYAHSAIMENFGIGLIEAMGCGLPLLAAPVGGIPEIFSDKVEGYYCDLEDPRQAAKLLIEILENEKIYRRMAEAGRKRYNSNFTPEILAPKLLSVLVGAHPPTADRIPQHSPLLPSSKVEQE